MKNLKLAWDQAMNRKGSFFSLIGIIVLNSLIFACISSLFDNIFHDSTFINIVFGILGLVLGFFTVISSFFLLKETVVEGRKLSFGEMYKEFFVYPARNWKKFLKVYAVWEIVVPVCISIAAGIVAFGIVALFASLFLGSFYNNLYYYRYMVDIMNPADVAYLIQSMGGSFILVMIGCVLAVTLLMVFVESITYYGFYKVYGTFADRPQITPSYKECFIAALIPIALMFGSSLILLLLMMIVITFSPLLALFMFFLLMFILILEYVAKLIYQYVVMVKIIDDVDQLPDYPGVAEFMNSNERGTDAVNPDIPFTQTASADTDHSTLAAEKNTAAESDQTETQASESSAETVNPSLPEIPEQKENRE